MAKQQPKTERFDGGVEGLLRYHRALHLLASCLLVPLAAAGVHSLWRLPGTGPLPDGFILFCSLPSIWFASSSARSIAISNLIVYATDGGPAEKSVRWRSALWRNIGFDLACCACFAVLLGMLHALAGELEPTIDLLVAESFLVLALGLLPVMVANIADKHSIGAQYYLGGMASYFFVYQEYSWKEEFILLPAALSLLLLLIGLFTRRQPLRNYLLANAFEFIAVASFLIVLATVANFSLGLDWNRVALLASVSALCTFAFYERIRRGFFTTDPEIIAKKMFGKQSPSERKMFGGQQKNHLHRLLNPLEGTPRRWQWVRLVLRLAPYAWLIALISTIAAVTARLSLL
ncbi:MAG: hypothetical protein ISN26_06435 [Betaproteobacteria bacterium AqS2]|uniref:Uncharacterized protein n=1 Tax=Candidatus Amphirhobacter heronislandensis TaxID=1732024 RepID=A0A930UHC2_9GAMM|nr:hypothetical protein [Betaproteobacteria bacterium AqS2]